MIELIMFLSIGLLTGCLIGVAVMPLVHNRAVRLTARRLKAALPQSIEEIEAGKDLLRADFAMSTRRLEIKIEQLHYKATSLLAQLGKKSDVINRLKIDRDVLKIEVMDLKTQIAALEKRLITADKGEFRVVSFVRQWIPHRIHTERPTSFRQYGNQRLGRRTS